VVVPVAGNTGCSARPLRPGSAPWHREALCPKAGAREALTQLNFGVSREICMYLLRCGDLPRLYCFDICRSVIDLAALAV